MRNNLKLMHSPKTFMCVFLFLLTTSVYAEVPSDGDPTGILESWTNADNELSDAYSQLLEEINDKDKPKLIQAQRLWIQTREADCKWAEFPDNLYKCQIDRNSSRAKQLKETSFRDRSGKSRKLTERGQ